MQTISDIKADLQTLLADQLGVWTRDDGSTLASIHSGRPPDGVRMTTAGVQCIIDDNAQLGVMPYMGGSASRGKYSHKVHLELWLPEDLEPPQLNVEPTVFALSGIEDSPVHRIMSAPAFLRHGVPINPSSTARTEIRKAMSIIYLNSYCINE